MKKQKNIFLLLAGFFILISLGFASAQTCYVTTYANCIGNGDNVAMRLSADANAHGEIASGAYTSIVCCDFGSGSTSCTGDNAIIRLSSAGNAHAEILNLVSPVYTEYYSCYNNLRECRGTTAGSCDIINEIEVLYLSDLTNAHASASGYSTRICCGFVPPAEDCSLTSARWGNDTVIEGQGVYLILEGINCSGANINFSIYEWDGTYHQSITSAFPSVMWTAERFGAEDDDYVNRIYFFQAAVLGAGESTATSGNLTVRPDINCSLYSFCSSYNSAQLCLADPCDVAELNEGYDPSLCGCEWNETNCNYACEVVDPETGVGVGKCTYINQVINNTCEEEPVGFLTFSWTGNWTWDEDCDAQCQEENEELKVSCERERGGFKRIECPAQILLPFFNIYNLILTVLVIAMVYAVMGILKKKKSKIRFK